MSYSTQRVVSDGSLVLLSVSIGYLERSHIHVFFNNVENGRPWAWVGLTNNQIAFSPAVPNGVEVLVARKTDLGKPYHIFTQGAQFTAKSLDEDIQQVLFIAQEATEQSLTGDFFQDVNMHGYKVKNAADAVDPKDLITLSQAADVVQGEMGPYVVAASASATAAAASASAAATSATASATSATTANASATAAALSAASISIGVPGGAATLNGAMKVVQKALDSDHADTATSATSASTAAACSGNSATATYATSAGTAAACSGNAASASSVPWSGISSNPFSLSGQPGQPGWLWGTNDGVTYAVWNPVNFSVNYANSAGYAGSSGNSDALGGQGIGYFQQCFYTGSIVNDGDRYYHRLTRLNGSYIDLVTTAVGV